MSHTTIEFLASFVILVIFFLTINYIVTFFYYIGKRINDKKLGITRKKRK